MTASVRARALEAIERGNGVLRLAPAWVPRSFCTPGRRIKLHPHDWYALGGVRGGIDERWLSSTVRADNGPLTGEHEGLSRIVLHDGEGDLGERTGPTLVEAVAELGADLVGARIWREHDGWPMYSKFFDNLNPLPFHIHQRDAHAALVGRNGKPEAYYFPPQLNNHGGTFPYTFFGLHPETTRDQLRARLAAFAAGDNRITGLSKAYRLEPGTGWDVPAGVLHAPGSLCTYEPQKASDVFAMYESVSDGRVIGEDLLWKDVPHDRRGDVDFLVDIVDWDANVEPAFFSRRFMAPVPIEGGNESWIVYRSDAFSAKELTVPPGATVRVVDAAAYGLICVQGHGTFDERPIESPALVRFGRLTHDEYFVSETAARRGVTVGNPSASDPLVLLKHFGPGNPDVPEGL